MLKRIFFLSLLYATFIFANESFTIDFNDDEIIINQYKSSQSKDLLIVFPSQHGLTDGLDNLLQDINKQNTEVWLVDPFSTWFLSATKSSLDKIPLDGYVQVIKEAQKTKKNIYLFSNDKGATNLLKTAHKWQLNSKNIISGIILVSPDLYQQRKNAGVKRVLDPIASSTNLPISVFIPENSILALHKESLSYALKTNGSYLQLQMLQNVRNRFFFRDDAIESELQLSNIFSSYILSSMKELKKHAKYKKAIDISSNQKIDKKTKRKIFDKYTGTLKAQDFLLEDLKGTKHSLSGYKGKVVLLNFWASWCPPCVEEIPSMTRLTTKLKDSPFTILAINLGESKKQMSKFIAKHKVNFPILLDPKKIQPKNWNVFAFPSSFIIDKTGKIRYSIAGGLNWDTQEVYELLVNLSKE